MYARIISSATALIFIVGHAACMLPRDSRRSIAARKSSLQPTQEWDVSRYQDQHSFVYKFGSSLLELADVQPGESVLDVGCGSGELTHALHQQAAVDQKSSDCTVMGLDADPQMIQRAQQQYPHVRFETADARDFTIAQPVDVVFSNAALHWVPPSDIDRAVGCIAAAMKPKGRLVVEFGGKGNIQSIVRACQETTGYQFDYWYFPSIADFASVLEKHGIEVISAELYDRPTKLEETSDGLSNWIRMFAKPFMETLEDPESVLAEINDRLRPKMFDGESWTADYRRIRIKAIKKE